MFFIMELKAILTMMTELIGLAPLAWLLYKPVRINTYLSSDWCCIMTYEWPKDRK
jgi:hypothetical protein